jgi:hypothetical protein
MGSTICARIARGGHGGIRETERGRAIATASGGPAAAIGQPVQIIYSRTDADGSLREARIDDRLSSPHLPTTSPSSALA